MNRRKRAFTHHLLPENVLETPTGCNAHLLWRAICSSIKETDIIGDCHAVFVVTRNPSRKDALARAARELIEGKFDWLPGPPARPTLGRACGKHLATHHHADALTCPRRFVPLTAR